MRKAESLWSRFKTEELAAHPQPCFADLADASSSVATYFDYCNYKRRNSTLAYQTPQTFYLHIRGFSRMPSRGKPRRWSRSCLTEALVSNITTMPCRWVAGRCW